MGTNSPNDLLHVRNHELQFVRDGEVLWRFSLADLLLVAEYTTDQGPLIEDYYFVFAVGRPAIYYEVGLGVALGILDELSAELGERIEPRLANSADWTSRILWPQFLVGRPLFNRLDQARPAGVWDRLKDRVVPNYQSEFDAAVSDYLGIVQQPDR